MVTIVAEPLNDGRGIELAGSEEERTVGGAAQARRVLRAIFRAHRGPILLTYGLFAVENTIQTAQPLALGLAIDGLLGASNRGLIAFVVVEIAHVAVGVLRRAYDTRMFGRIHAALVAQLVLDQRGRDVEVTRIAARSALSREFADFFERQVPVAIRMVFMIVGGLSILAIYDPILVLECLALILPAAWINNRYARRTFELSRRLHDTLEREVDIIDRGDRQEIVNHYGAVARWQVRLSDSEAWNFGTMELFVMTLTAAALVRSCGITGTSTGAIMALLRYVLMFVVGLDGLPVLIQQMSRLRDVGSRCAPSCADDLSWKQ